METNPTRMCALLVGLPDVTVLGVGEWPGWLRVVIATVGEQPSCCGRRAWRHGVREVVLVDLPVFGAPGAAGVAQATLAMRDLSARVDRTGPRDRLDPLCDDDTGGTMGDAPSRPAQPLGVRGRCRCRL